jgi:hypothetical protein
VTLPHGDEESFRNLISNSPIKWAEHVARMGEKRNGGKAGRKEIIGKTKT